MVNALILPPYTVMFLLRLLQIGLLTRKHVSTTPIERPHAAEGKVDMTAADLEHNHHWLKA